MLFPQKIDVVASARHANPHNETVVVQNDTAVEFYVAVVGDNGQTDLPEGATYTLVCLHLRKEPTEKLGTLQEDGNVMFKLTHMELSEAGPVQAQVRVYHPVGGRLTSNPFTFHVAPDPTYGAEIKPEDQSIIEQVIGEGPGIIAEAKKETELNITERARLTGAVGGALSSLADDKAQALLEISQSKDAADQSAQVAQQAADNADDERELLTLEVSDKLDEVETARSATVDATGEATEAAELAREEAEAARLQKEEVQEVIGAGPVASVNGQTGVVSGLATQESVDQVTAQLADTDAEARRKKDLEDLTPRALAAIEGGGGTSFNLLSIPQDGSVTPAKTTYFKPTRNLFTDVYLPLKLLGSSSTARVRRYDAANLQIAFTEVQPNTTYTIRNHEAENIDSLSNLRFSESAIHYEDLNFGTNDEATLLSTVIARPSTLPVTITTKNDTKYLYVEIGQNGFQPKFQVEKGSESTAYTPPFLFPADLIEGGNNESGLDQYLTTNGAKWEVSQ